MHISDLCFALYDQTLAVAVFVFLVHKHVAWAQLNFC